MKRVLTDNMKAVAGLYIMYAEELKAYFCSYARNTNIANALQYAEDMTHDLYLKVMESIYLEEVFLYFLLYLDYY